MYLGTGNPTVRAEAGRIIAVIPSGNQEIEIALNYGQATRLGELMIRDVRAAIQKANSCSSADVIALKQPAMSQEKDHV